MRSRLGGIAGRRTTSVPPERGVRAEDHVVGDVTVVGDVHVSHEDVAIADHRDPSAAAGAAVDGDELAEDIPPPDDQLRLFALVLQILRRETDVLRGPPLLLDLGTEGPPA